VSGTLRLTRKGFGIELKGEPGFRGVGVASSELQIWLPGGLGYAPNPATADVRSRRQPPEVRQSRRGDGPASPEYIRRAGIWR
jgi:hypothetical protein